MCFQGKYHDIRNTFISENNTGRLFQVTLDGGIGWEYVNRGGTTQASQVSYDFTPVWIGNNTNR
jgi:hypothetical protein